jgi:UDP-N-acetylmuramoyl-tripeptide--D-alanyl-D-alanine ligase
MLLIESIITYLSYIVVLIAYYINKPIEKIIEKYNKTKAIDKLKTIPNLQPIFITGSYGKTSSKMILNDILRIKYNVSKTPRDLNTEYGLTLTINNYLTRNDEIFITDVGGYKPGEISKLCKMLKPKYGIITNIGITDLDTFGNSENILKTRFELIEALPLDGIAVLNKDDKNQVNYNIKNKCKKIWIGIKDKDADIIAKDIECNQNGSKFNVVFKGNKEKYPFETKLLGNYNIYNILASIALGRELGITIEELQNTIKKVRQIEGRLELKDYKYMYQLDNTYNTNPIGAKVGLDVLELMPGKKVVVTDGINPTLAYVKEKEINHIYGHQIAKLKPDLVILVGENQTKHIFRGLLESGYSKDNIYVVRSMNDAYNLIQNHNSREKVYALFE